MNFIDIFNNRPILIPLLQRDYVQGGREVVIAPFLDALLRENAKCDLNYIYGYDENGCFVPVDGQQRLITLWLLYLYVFARAGHSNRFSVELRFASREYANDFCRELKQHLPSMLQSCALSQLSGRDVQQKDTFTSDANQQFNRRDKQSLDVKIQDQQWFITSWLSNTTVRNMLHTLKHLHRRVTNANMEAIYTKLISQPCDICFSFYSLDEKNGIDDDVYIKMNGRGRALSPFENLKSWIDEQLPTLETRGYSVQNWKRKMDNEWTHLFWQNRNMGQACPEEIDDEQLYCFYNLIILYQLRLESILDGKSQGTLLSTITSIKRDNVNQYEELCLFLKIHPSEKQTEVDVNDVKCAIYGRLLKGNTIPIVWFERLNLLTDDFFVTAYQWMNRLYERAKIVNDSDLYIGADIANGTKKIYQLALCEGSFNKTLPLLYAVLAYEETPVSSHSFLIWMRLCRNLILNTEIHQNNLGAKLLLLDVAALQFRHAGRKGMLDAITDFNQRQVREEVLKTALESQGTVLTSLFEKMENNRFFQGRINVLFEFLKDDENDSLAHIPLERVEAYVNVFLTIFLNLSRSTNVFDDKYHYFRRALMCKPPYYFGIWEHGGWCFCTNMEEWRRYVLSEAPYIVDARRTLKAVMKEVLVPVYDNTLDNTLLQSILATQLQTFVEEQLIDGSDTNYFRYYFIHYPKVWDYMNSKCCSWSDNNYDIMLKEKEGNSCLKTELRTYCLYLDYLKKLNADDKSKKTWSLLLRAKDKSQVRFKHQIIRNSASYTVKLDAYFHDEKMHRTCENSYGINLYIHQQIEATITDSSEIKQLTTTANKEFFEKYFVNLLTDQELGLIQKENGYYGFSHPLSKEAFIPKLDKLLAELNS